MAGPLFTATNVKSNKAISLFVIEEDFAGIAFVALYFRFRFDGGTIGPAAFAVALDLVSGSAALPLSLVASVSRHFDGRFQD